jgi:site-specific DNA recombinase
MKVVAIYARVSSEQRKEENTIASQTAALLEFAREQGYSVPDEWVIEDEGFSGASLLRPGLERLRDLAAVARLLREMGPPTRHRASRWERSVVWAILRNPAYKGAACFNKTRVGQRQKITKPFRLSGRRVHGEKSSGHERPREEWIEIPVPAIVSEETFALAEERLADNKRFAPRRTIEPSIVHGLVSCRKCGYALSRTSTRSSARKIHYYRCLGSDAWRHLGGAVCGSRPIRQDLLDQIVWQEVIRLIEDPALIQTELDRRLDAARIAEPGRTLSNAS